MKTYRYEDIPNEGVNQLEVALQDHSQELESENATLRAEVARLKAACDKWSEEDILYPRSVHGGPG